MNRVTPIEELADVFSFDIPPSHRARWGGAITGAKRLLTRGLGPVQRELLRGQVRFNRALARLLGAPGAELAREARETLGPLADPGALEVGGGMVRQVAGLASDALRGELLAGQHAWNLAVIELLEAVGWPPRVDRVGGRLDELEARSDVLADWRGRSVLRSTLPLWREVLRRQVAFNHACVVALRHLLGVARPFMAMPAPEDYERWCRSHEFRDIQAAAEAVRRLERQPLISLVTPAYSTPPHVLRACIDSVRAQSYPRWELCIVDDGSPGPDVERTVRELAREEPRIRFERLPVNGGIARATNAAIALASGEYVGFLDHDDLLRPHALAEVVLRLAAEPETDVLYSDEDKVDMEGRRFAPYLKPELSPDLLRAVNYVCHFLVVRSELLRDVGGIRPGFEGAQDHDLILRLLERTSRFAHIPKVLYHWRALPGSTSVDASAKPAASEAGRRAVAEHLQRLGEKAEVLTAAPGLYRVRYVHEARPSVSVLMAHPASPEWLAARVRTVLDTTAWPEFEVLVPGPPGRDVRFDGRVRVVPCAEELSPGARANLLAREARGSMLLWLEPGVEPTDPAWLDELVSQALRPEVGVVGARVAGSDGCVRHAGLGWDAAGRPVSLFAGLPDPALGPFGASHWPRNLLAVSGECMMVRRDTFERLGGFDETFSGAGAEVDFCFRAVGSGLRVLYTPHIRLMRSSDREREPLFAPDLERLRARCDPLMRAGRDPFFHPNLGQGGLGSEAPWPR